MTGAAAIEPRDFPSLTTEAVAELLGLNPETVRRMAKRGDLPAYRVAGRLHFTPNDVARVAFAQPVKPRRPLPDPVDVPEPRRLVRGSVARLDEIEREAQEGRAA